ncbi:MAG: cell surface protein, partial [Xanthomonadales bacterium]|nr:cell surface protein [Xanthomonadales bacterium]
MNRKNLTAAVLAGLAGAAGIAGTAQAVNINPDGLGQVLVYPYYTSRGGNQTLLSVVNTTEDAKAVKVRFLEGYNSREVLDFNMYMSAYDVWVAAVADDGAGTPTLYVPDSTCTAPYLFAQDSDGDGV